MDAVKKICFSILGFFLIMQSTAYADVWHYYVNIANKSGTDLDVLLKGSLNFEQSKRIVDRAAGLFEVSTYYIPSSAVVTINNSKFSFSVEHNGWVVGKTHYYTIMSYNPLIVIDVDGKTVNISPS